MPHFTSMDSAAHLSALQTDGRAIVEAAELGLDAPVPSCPGWNVADLVGHTGVVHRWATAVVQSRTMTPMRLRDVTDNPPSPQQRIEWFSEALDGLCDALDRTDLDADIWTWTGQRPARFWARRMAHETAMHRWDAENAHGRARPFDSSLAVDGIDEMFDVFVPHHPGCSTVRGHGETLHLHCTDSAGEWLLRFGSDSLDVDRAHAKGDAAVRASASDLLLLLWGRRTADGLDVFGDASVLRLWTDAAKI